jgi:hypothetical protein
MVGRWDPEVDAPDADAADAAPEEAAA